MLWLFGDQKCRSEVRQGGVKVAGLERLWASDRSVLV